MESLIAVPRWVLFFGITNLILTLVNVIVLYVLARRVGARFVDELVRRGIGQIRAEGAPMLAPAAPPEIVDVPGPFYARRAPLPHVDEPPSLAALRCHCANPDRIASSAYCGNCGGDL